VGAEIFFPIFTLVQRCVSTKLEVSRVFLFRKSEARDGQTDGRTNGCNAECSL